MEKIYLDVPYANRVYAQEKGATWDKEKKQWYVWGDVPVDLLGFLPKPTPMPIKRPLGPSCPKCGCIMELRSRKSDGEQFWGCSAYPRCQESTPYIPKSGLDHAAAVAIREIFGSENDKPNARASKPPSPPNPEKDKLVARAAAIYELATTAIKGQAQVNRWFNTPKMALGRRMPKEVLDTQQGCEQVEKLLRELIAEQDFSVLLDRAVKTKEDLTGRIQDKAKELQQTGMSTKEINDLIHDRDKRKNAYKPRPALGRTNLKVPFSDKGEAKRLGAMWSPNLKTWFVDIGADLNKFEKWL